MKKPTIVSWHPVLTAHQSHTLIALQRVWGAKVEVVVAGTENHERRRQGWTVPDTSTLTMITLSGMTRWRAVRDILASRRDSIHLFGSPFESRLFMAALWWAQLKGVHHIYLISEPYSTEAAGYLADRKILLSKIKASIRPLIYRLYGHFLLRRVSGVFAISNLAVRQYISLGVTQRNIAPFGYFVPSIGDVELAGSDSNKSSALNIVFVGSLISIKGLDILMNAVRATADGGAAVSLDVYGPGDPSRYQWDKTHSKYCGVIPFGKSQSIISNYDVLVLPSRYDGWGVVVNEAIQAGVPVLCSDRVGAGAMLTHLGCGEVFDLDDEGVHLSELLWRLVKEPDHLLALKRGAQTAAPKLEPSVAGRYMADVLQSGLRGSPKPICPWY